MGDDKARENRARRAAERQGLVLSKARRRDTRALDYGRYVLIDARTNSVVWGASNGWYNLELDGVEDYLNRDRHAP